MGETIFSKNLRYERMVKNITQQCMAESLHITNATYSKWESGTREPSIDSIMEIADTLEIPVGNLFTKDNKDRNKYDGCIATKRKAKG